MPSPTFVTGLNQTLAWTSQVVRGPAVNLLEARPRP
jgi:hypothetical protein